MIDKKYRGLKSLPNSLNLFEGGGVVASLFVRSSPDRSVWDQVLAGDIVWCFYARHFILTVPLFTKVFQWIPADLMSGATL